MKKTFKTLMFTTLATGMLAGCTPAAAPNWSKDDSSLMSENLYGYVLPYLSQKGLTVSLDEESGFIEVKGPQVDSTVLAKYAQKFSEKDGWGSIPEFEGVAPEGSYGFRKRFEVPDVGSRYLVVTFGNGEVEETTPANGAEDGSAAEETKELEFVLQIGDLYKTEPFGYSFPAELLESAMKAAKIPVDLDKGKIPSFEAGTYYFTRPVFTPDEKYIDYFQVTGYDIASDPSTAYAAALTAAGFDSLGDSAHQEYNVTYKYESSKQEFSIMVNVAAGFPAYLVNTYLKSTYAPSSDLDLFPALNYLLEYDSFSGFNTSLLESRGRVIAFFDDSTELVSAYTQLGTVLKAQNFTDGVPSYGFNTYVSPNEQYQLSPWYNTDYGYLFLDFGEVVEPVVEWPAEQLATDFESLGLDTSTPLPAYPGEFTNVSYDFDEDEREITILLNMDEDPDLLTNYVPLMSAFIPDGSGTSGDITYWDYVSPENSYKVEFYYNADLGGVLFIIDAFYDKVPVDNMKSDLECEDSTFDLFVPSFEVEGAFWYYYFSSRYYQSNGLYIITLEATLESAEAVTAAIADITADFTALGYQEGSKGDIFTADFSAGVYLTRVWVEADDKNDCKLSITIYWFADAIENYVNPQE